MPIDLNSTRAVLRPSAVGREFTLERQPPSPGLAHVVERYWSVRWDRRGLAPHVQETLPNPNVHLVVEHDREGVHGVWKRRFTTTLTDEGWVFGAKLRPGAFRRFIDAPVSTLTGRVVPFAAVFGQRGTALVAAVRSASSTGERVAAAESFLLEYAPIRDELALVAARVVDEIASDPSIVRVSDVVARCGIGERSLQRIFRSHVGVGAKWVIRRYRLQEAAERIAAGSPASGSALAHSLGYYDQAHFIRDFTALVGVPPGTYARQAAGA